MIEEEHCIKKDECLCGTATQKGIIFVSPTAHREAETAKAHRG